MCSITSDICFHSDLCSAHFWCMAFTSLCGSFVWEGSRTHSVASSSSPARLHSKLFLLFTWSAGKSLPSNTEHFYYEIFSHHWTCHFTICGTNAAMYTDWKQTGITCIVKIMWQPQVSRKDGQLSNYSCKIQSSHARKATETGRLTITGAWEKMPARHTHTSSTWPNWQHRGFNVV